MVFGATFACLGHHFKAFLREYFCLLRSVLCLFPHPEDVICTSNMHICYSFYTDTCHVICHVTCVMCHLSCVICHVSCVMCHVSCIMYHVSCVMSCNVMSYHVNTSYLSSCACRCIYVASLSCSFSRFFVLLFCLSTYLRVRACMRALAGWPLRKHKRCFCRCGSRTRD